MHPSTNIQTPLQQTKQDTSLVFFLFLPNKTHLFLQVKEIIDYINYSSNSTTISLNSLLPENNIIMLASNNMCTQYLLNADKK